MKDETWNRLNKEFAMAEEVAGAAITKASEVPSGAEIIEAAQRLNCKFHEDYVEFLRRYGAATVGAYHIRGLRPVHVMGESWSVVDTTMRYRDDNWPGTADWYIISDDGFGNPIGVSPDGRVWISDHDFGGITLLAENFEEFLLTYCLKD